MGDAHHVAPEFRVEAGHTAVEVGHTVGDRTCDGQAGRAVEEDELPTDQVLLAEGADRVPHDLVVLRGFPEGKLQQNAGGGGGHGAGGDVVRAGHVISPSMEWFLTDPR